MPFSRPIEDYALLSDCKRAALVSKDGSIDWLCLPRFDSPACFCALLGSEKNGKWQISPKEEFSSQRRYLPDTMVVETTFQTRSGKVNLTDFLVTGREKPLLLRKISGVSGKQRLRCLLSLRFDYGSVVPWIRKTASGVRAVAGPDEVYVEGTIALNIDEDLNAVAEFEVSPGQDAWLALQWNSDFNQKADPITNQERLLTDTENFWRNYAARIEYEGPYQEVLKRSILTLKALTFEPTGGIVAAPTTSLPETLGGERNWDYRYCWIRDSTFSMYALLNAGYREEAQNWRSWLVRAVAGTPSQVNIMYGLSGERRLHEIELPWLSGYEDSKPVRTGNAAYQQLQLDVFGETLDTLWLGLKSGLPFSTDSWKIQNCFVEFLMKHWQDPDEGIWEVRGPRQHFTHSKVMAWVAIDRAIRSAKLSGVQAPLEKWAKLRDEIKSDICTRGFDAELNSFTQAYGSKNLDASLLMIPIVGFLPPQDPRVIGTIAAVEKELFHKGFVLRYQTKDMKDVLHGREGTFLACSFWLADCWILTGRRAEAERLFESLLSLANDVQLMAEEYDTENKRMIGNFPQALSHIALINTAFNLARHHGPAKDRSRTEEDEDSDQKK